MATASPKRRSGKSRKGRPAQHPKRRETNRTRGWLPAALLAAALTETLVVLAFAKWNDGDEVRSGSPVAGLPNTPDYHSLLVSPESSSALLLGTHEGLFSSRDGGRHWRFETLSGQDAMNLARPSRNVLWTAGHNVLAKSSNGGRSWKRTLDLPEGAGPIAWAPRSPNLAYVVGFDRTLYRTSDGGRSWQPVGEGG